MVKNRQPNNSGKDSGNLCKIKQMGKGHTCAKGRKVGNIGSSDEQKKENL